MATAQQVAHYSQMALQAAALKAHAVPGYAPRHNDHGGECAAELHDTPVLLRYTLTTLGVEVEEVSINGAAIPAAYFDADTRAGWASDCERARTAAGWAL